MSKDTLQLPKTAFSMKASLPLKEPEILKKWEKNKIFEKLRKKSKGKEKFILHDGPPYANGHIHMGTYRLLVCKNSLPLKRGFFGFFGITIYCFSLRIGQYRPFW